MLLYDGDCGFCTRSVALIRQRFSPEVEMVPWQSVDLSRYGLSEERLQREVVFVDNAHGAPGDRRPGGATALALTLARGNRAGRVLGRALAAPPVRPLAAGCYRLVARNRYRMPGSSTACAVGPAAPPRRDAS
ncbi:thiol-disulfide oxidoreductase DCC family protein [Streptomyces scabichelini]|nr:DUF393 domain-containing protein [Streptomyces scabichelini]